jgi:hypothetical protein
MVDVHWEVIDEVAGELQAEIIRGFLEAQGFQVWLSKEGASSAYSLGIGVMGRVQVLVPSDVSTRARKILEDYYAGKFESEPVDLDNNKDTNGTEEE